MQSIIKGSLRKLGSEPSGRRNWFTGWKVLFLLAAAAAGAVFYAFKIEPRWIEVTRHEVHLPGLPEELDGLKIVQLSDLHRSHLVQDSTLQKAVRLANAQTPDVVVLTGDFINHPIDNAGPCAQILSNLEARYGVFAVLGNHDHWEDSGIVAAQLRSHGIDVLDNENRKVAAGLFIIGIDDQWAGNPHVEKAWQGVDESAGQVLISHTPLAISLLSDHRCLMLTGHTHGGQIVIPFIPRSRLPGLKGWRYISGWYYEDDVAMYVNRGIGMINPAVRFLCRPEVSVFRLRSGEDTWNWKGR